MQVTDLDGRISNLKLIGNIAKGSRTNKSALHLQAREIIKECFPTLQVLEEVAVSIRYGQTLYMDFYLPLNKKCIEVHGQQHYKFNRFYHRDKMGFIKHKKRDREKQEWCEINGIKYIPLPYNENTVEWKERIENNNDK